MNNREIKVQAAGRKSFDLAMQLIFEDTPGKTATHFKFDPELGMVFHWHEEKGTIPLPFAMGCNLVADLAWGWLESIIPPGEPTGFDGSYDKGFEVTNRGCGDGWSFSFLAVKPVWAYYGK
jgi:hypothetical protein